MAERVGIEPTFGTCYGYSHSSCGFHSYKQAAPCAPHTTVLYPFTISSSSFRLLIAISV